MKRLVMSADMRADEARPLTNLILNACKKIGVDISGSGYKNIREALVNGNGNFHLEMQNLVLQEAMSQYSRGHGF